MWRKFRFFVLPFGAESTREEGEADKPGVVSAFFSPP
jgi:hypothetical protein